MLKPETVKQAFEVEDVSIRMNYMFVYDPEQQTVDLYDTSRNVPNKKRLLLTDKVLFPVGKNAYEYFTYVYRKAIGVEFNPHPIHFLGFVDPETVEPLEEEEDES